MCWKSLQAHTTHPGHGEPGSAVPRRRHLDWTCSILWLEAQSCLSSCITSSCVPQLQEQCLSVLPHLCRQIWRLTHNKKQALGKAGMEGPSTCGAQVKSIYKELLEGNIKVLKWHLYEDNLAKSDNIFSGGWFFSLFCSGKYLKDDNNCLNVERFKRFWMNCKERSRSTQQKCWRKDRKITKTVYLNGRDDIDVQEWISVEKMGSDDCQAP